MRAAALIAAAVVSGMTGTGAAAQTAGGPRVGDVIRSDPGQTIGGWEHLSGGLHVLRTSGMNQTVETLECCQTLLRKGKVFAVIGSEAASRDDKGGITSERIRVIRKVEQRPEEEQVECRPLWLDPALSLKDAATGIVRSYLYDGETISELRWVPAKGACEYDG